MENNAIFELQRISTSNACFSIVILDFGVVSMIPISHQIWVFPKIVVPPNHPFNRVFHYKPSILGYLYYGKHPYATRKNLSARHPSHSQWSFGNGPRRRKPGNRETDLTDNVALRCLCLCKGKKCPKMGGELNFFGGLVNRYQFIHLLNFNCLGW